jgi:hypothetical protein
LTGNRYGDRLLIEMAIKEAVVDLPENLGELGLHEGDRVEGHIRDGKIVLVFRIEETKKPTSDVGFGTRWRGKFKDVKDRDLSDDPRAQRILNH